MRLLELMVQNEKHRKEIYDTLRDNDWCIDVYNNNLSEEKVNIDMRRITIDKEMVAPIWFTIEAGDLVTVSPGGYRTEYVSEAYDLLEELLYNTYF